MSGTDHSSGDVNAISEATRRDIFDALRLDNVQWEGRLTETEFLARLFDLAKLPSTDLRNADMLADVSMHHEAFDDWGGHNWVYEDNRLSLLRGSDDAFLRFLCEMIHPIVRSDEAEIDKLLQLFNGALARDGYRIVVKSTRSGRQFFAAARTISLRVAGTEKAKRVADELESGHIMDQITRMEASIESDPSLAIGSAKEFVETLCKAILSARGISLSGKEDFPKLVYDTREALNLTVSKKTEVTLRATLGALGTLVNGIAELRGQLGTGHGAHPDVPRPPNEIARLAVGMATSLGLFLWDIHQANFMAVKPNSDF